MAEVAVNNEVNLDNILNSHYLMVKEFHHYFGHPIRNVIYEEMFNDDNSTIANRSEFIRSEYDEFLEAQRDDDMVEMADALCDLAYFVFGSYLCFGIEFKTNINFDDVNVIQPVNNDDLEYNLVQIEEHIANLENGKNLPYNIALAALENNLEKLLEITYTTGYGMGFDMNVLFSEVHRSNMTKLCTTEEDAIVSVQKYKDEGKYDSPNYRVYGKYFVVYNESNGKILKSHIWEEPQLHKFIDV